MPQGHVILLANFYGSYLNQSKFRAAVIVNNAGIEQLATLGVEKLKEVRSAGGPDDVYYVLVVAGLTDVLIKSIEEGKNKLEITPNSMQLLETKMQWANSLLSNEGAKLIWVIMPPISLRMYHMSEGWNINKIPGMSLGLDQEQRQLNSLMYSYRSLCQKFNFKEAKKICNGPYFTDLVSELSHDRGTINLNTGYFESDGISPTKKLVENWSSQVNKIFLAVGKLFVSRPRTPPEPRSPPTRPMLDARRGDSWDLPPPRGRADERGDRPLKRPYDDSSFPGSRGLIGLGSEPAYDFERGRQALRDHEHENYPLRAGGDVPPAKIPSLLDMPGSMESQRRQSGNRSALPNLPEPASNEISTAVQLLAATMQLGGSNPNNVQSVLKALMAQKGSDERRLEDERIKRRMEDEHLAMKKQEEERRTREARMRLDEMKRIEDAKREEVRFREEMRRREEDRRREERLMEERRLIEVARRRDEERARQADAQKRAEEQRLREIQIAAKLAMEQQKREEERQRQAKVLQDQQAQMALMAVTKNVREQIAQKQSQENAKLKATNVLDRLNEKLKSDREKKEPPAKIDRNVAKDVAWTSPVVLFSFLNRTNERRPLRGIFGQKLARSSTRMSDLKSRGHCVYNEPGAPTRTVGFLKIKVRQPGAISEFETKVADFNNRIYEMMDECDALLQEGRSNNYIMRRETDEPKSVTKGHNSSTNSLPKPTVGTSEPATSDSVRSSNKSQKGNAAAGKVKDLRENINRSAHRRARSRTPNDSKKPASNPLARQSADAKPRWDQSDESEEELLWDDDQASVKVTADADDDDIKFVEETEAPTILPKGPFEGVNSGNSDGDNPVQDDGNAENFLTIDEAA